MEIDIDFKPLEHYLELIKSGKPFSISRIWDGEMSCITGRDGQNSDACRYTPELRERLCQSITNNLPYYHALYDPIMHAGTQSLQTTFRDWVNINAPAVKWVDAMIWQRCFERGEFNDKIVKLLQTKKVLFVGGIHLKLVCDKLGFNYYETLSSNSYASYEKIESDILKVYKNFDIIIFCCGMATNCFIDDLFPAIGDNITMLDMGSVFSAYCGYTNRIWIRRMPLSTLRKSRGE
jgi:hypothetical protein